MYCITDEQVDYILNDIRRNGVDTEDLKLNLLDHICCILEQELKEGDDFELRYRQTIQQFYKRELREIEDETIRLLTFKNYYAMKKSMMITGAYAAIAITIGSLFKIMRWPGAGILLVSAIAVFSFVFLPLAFLLKTKETGTLREKWVLAIATLVGILYCLSMIFQVQHWPGARIIWLTTLIISFFVLIPVYFFSGIRKPETKVNTIVATILLVGFLGVQFTMTALRPSPEMQGRVYTYLQSEQLLASRQMDISHSSGLTRDIQATCEQIKHLILKHEMGVSSIPFDYEKKGVIIKEKYIGDFFMTGEGQALLTTLYNKVKAYNMQASNKIPLEHSILEPGFADRPFCSNLFVLNNIAQLQLYLTTVGNEETPDMALIE